jgi:hypothetical protein
MRTLLMLALFFPVAAFAQTAPRLFLEINNVPQKSLQRGLFGGIVVSERNWIGSADEVRTIMIRKYKIEQSQFTENRAKADYVLRIVVEGSCCRWTVVKMDRDENDGTIIQSKLVNFCSSAIKDVVAVSRQDWKERSAPVSIDPIER